MSVALAPAPALIIAEPPAEPRPTVALDCPDCNKVTDHQLGAVISEFPLTTLRRVDCQPCGRARLWWDDAHDHPGRIWGQAPYRPRPVPLTEPELRARALREFPRSEVAWVAVDTQSISITFPGGFDQVQWTVGEQTILCTPDDEAAWMDYAATVPYVEQNAVAQ